MRDIPPSAWIGVTAESQVEAEIRIPILLRIPRETTKFVSIEPMLGPVKLRRWMRGIDWVIAGPETGAKARRCDNIWIDALSNDSPCFFDKRNIWTRREFPTKREQ
jgi:protein gp37